MLARSLRFLAVLPLLSGCGGARMEQVGTTNRTLQFQGDSIQYSVFVPSVQRQGAPFPALLLLHGAHGNGPDFLPLWQPFAEANGIVLIAPTLSLSAEQETQVTLLLPALLDAAGVGLNLDATRTYVFGYSAGGYFAYDAATLLSNRFAAVAVFAMVIAPEYSWIVQRAARKTPIAIYIGDHDQFWSLAQTRATRDLLINNGFPVHYLELPDQDHAYARVADQVNQDAWDFMSKVAIGK